MRTYIGQQTPGMFSLLEDLVLIQSSSYNKAGVDQVAARIAAAFEGDPITCETVPQFKMGNHLVARTSAAQRCKHQVMLSGHMDTVFPIDTDFNWYKEDAEHCFGPGVADMKGGLVAGIYALKALAAGELLDEIPVAFVFNSDEEIGSGSSRELIRTEARRSAFALVLESAGLNGEVVTGRKGNIALDLAVRGQAGHAAYAGPDKGSAILELAHKTLAFESLNDPDSGITVNVGLVAGGIGSNTVAQNASAKIDFRYTARKDYIMLQEQIDKLVKRCTEPNTTASCKITSSRPPMSACKDIETLFAVIATTGTEMGIDIRAEHRQGVSDANLIAAEGVPVVDGLGPIGDRDHSADEYIRKASLPERALLIAGSLLAGWKQLGG